MNSSDQVCIGLFLGLALLSWSFKVAGWLPRVWSAMTKRINLSERAKEWIAIALMSGLIILVAWGVTAVLPSIEATAAKLYPPAPTATSLDCHPVRVPGYLYAHQLCAMPDGTQCLFYNSKKPATCYPEAGTK